MNIFVYWLNLKYYVATLSHTRPPILIHYLLLTLERAITIMSPSYLGNTTVEERYDQHSYMLPR